MTADALKPLNKTVRIHSWLDLIQAPDHQQRGKRSLSPDRADDCDHERRCKRARSVTEPRPRASTPNLQQTILPSSPPLTGLLVSMSAASGRSLKRPASDVDATSSTGFSIPLLPTKRAKSRSVSPTKSPKKFRGVLDLQELKKPVWIKGGHDSLENLPADVKSLYQGLQKTSLKEEVIPNEVFDQIPGPLPRFLRRSASTACAEANHAALYDIHLEAVEAVAGEYHESGWNAVVHGPLLKLVFPSRPQPAPASATRARMVPAMTAVIHQSYIPEMRSKVPAQQPSPSPRPAPSEAFSQYVSDAGTDGDSMAARSDTKKVDYALTMEPAFESPLSRFLEWFLPNESVDRKTDTPSHVNQSLYGPLRFHPIACSIETKLSFAAQDPKLQLGIWVAAWHRRMYKLREYLFSEFPDLRHILRQRDRLPTTLLIEVASHEWRLYFACDREAGVAIDMVGPVRLGSTDNLPDIYALFASLQAIQAWIEADFRKELEKWFLVTEMMESRPSLDACVQELVI